MIIGLIQICNASELNTEDLGALDVFNFMSKQLCPTV